MTDSDEFYKQELRAVGAGEGAIANIAHMALMLAGLDRPGVSFQKYEHHLEILDLDLSSLSLPSQSAPDRATALVSVLHEGHDYCGNEDYYEDLQNANLMSVIDTRKGLPVTLAILYIHVARSGGWHIEGLNFPGHFLIRLYGEAGDQVIIDPFHGGKIREAQDLRLLLKKFAKGEVALKPEYYQAISDRDILVRLLNNIKIRCLKVSDLGQAMAILSRLTWIDPGQIQHHYELGMLLAHVEKVGPARERLLYCLDRLQDNDHNDLIRQQIKNTLQALDKLTPGAKIIPYPEQEI